MVGFGTGQPKEGKSRSEGQHRKLEIIRPISVECQDVSEGGTRSRMPSKKCRSGVGAEFCGHYAKIQRFPVRTCETMLPVGVSSLA